jgi:hypothetical protein
VRDRLVPVSGCGCTTCVKVRDARENAAIDAHYDKVGNLLGLDDTDYACPCGEQMDADGRCLKYWACPYSVEGVVR